MALEMDIDGSINLATQSIKYFSAPKDSIITTNDKHNEHVSGHSLTFCTSCSKHIVNNIQTNKVHRDLPFDCLLELILNYTFVLAVTIFFLKIHYIWNTILRFFPIVLYK